MIASIDRPALRRTASLARWNAVLLTRNRLALVYAVVMPLLPLALLLSGERGSASTGASAVVTMFLVIGLYPVFYNILSQFVSRRDELVLKRMRTGQVRDGELLAGIALPGAVAALALAAIAVPAAVALGQDAPLNPLLYAALAVLVVVMFVAFAFWTAAWTRSAEAAQLTSLPVILLAAFGPLLGSIPGLSEGLQDLVALTPGSAMSDLIRIGWFGLDGQDAKEPTLSIAETWGPAAAPLAAMVAWTVVGVSLARRSLRWEPRT